MSSLITPTSILVLSIWPELITKNTFKSFFQGHKGSVNSVFNLHFWFVSFLQKDFCVFSILSNCCGFPVIKSSWWVDLNQMWSFFVITSNQDWNTEWSVSSCLSLLLDKFGSLSAKSLDSHRFVIFDEISLDKFSWFLG